MLLALPVVVIGTTLAAGSYVVLNRAFRAGAVLLVAAAMSTKGYRRGEGLLSKMFPLTISREMAQELAALNQFEGVTFKLTRSEMKSVQTIASILDPRDPKTSDVLADFLSNIPDSRRSQ